MGNMDLTYFCDNYMLLTIQTIKDTIYENDMLMIMFNTFNFMPVHFKVPILPSSILTVKLNAID